MKENKHRFPYKWELKNTIFTKDKGTVFSCFACGGGSTMGYKLAGFDVIGCNEIDPKMMEAYIANHNPKYSFLEPIQTFKLNDDLPKELYNLDILDGSPPCSSFSVAGNREKDWGKKKKFREGQSKQVLDTLFFDFIDLAKKLQPKVVVAENVKGLLIGNAKEYVRKIYKEFDAAGYYCQHFLLDAKKMGVPQRRERVFFICLRKDLAEKFMYNVDMFTQIPEIKMMFNEPVILFKEIYDGKGKKISEHALNAWNHRKKTDTKLSQSKKRAGMKETDFNNMYVFKDKVMPTITGKAENAMTLFDEPIKPSETEITLAGSFPLDYKCDKIGYVVGMSVPPVCMANISLKIYQQWLQYLK